MKCTTNNRRFVINTKFILFISLGLFTVTTLHAQDTKTFKKFLSSSLEEIYTAPKSDKKVKNGPYSVFDKNKKIPVVNGVYKDNNKDSVWTYYGADGNVIQKYDFKKKQLLFEREDSLTIVHASYTLVGVVASETDSVQPPVKIGGVDYGFYLLYDARQIPNEMRNETTNANNRVLRYVFQIAEDGKLEFWDIVFADANSVIQKQRQSILHLPADAYEFIPALVNGKPVRSQYSYSVFLTVNQYNAPTPGTNHIMMSQKND